MRVMVGWLDSLAGKVHYFLITHLSSFAQCSEFCPVIFYFCQCHSKRFRLLHLFLKCGVERNLVNIFVSYHCIQLRT